MKNPLTALGHFLGRVGHWIYYLGWLFIQMLRESLLMATDVYTAGRHIAPVVVYYPLRLRSEREIAYFITSIIMTPGTLALGITGSKEVDFDAAMGERDVNDVHAASSHLEDLSHGVAHVNRYLAVHAVYGDDPMEILEGLANMEEHLDPSVKSIQQYFDIDHLVERGVKGTRGYGGVKGGRSTDASPFSIESVDSTPHDSAVDLSIARQLAAASQELDEQSDVSEQERQDAHDVAIAAAEIAQDIGRQRQADSRRGQDDPRGGRQRRKEHAQQRGPRGGRQRRNNGTGRSEDS